MVAAGQLDQPSSRCISPPISCYQGLEIPSFATENSIWDSPDQSTNSALPENPFFQNSYGYPVVSGDSDTATLAKGEVVSPEHG